MGAIVALAYNRALQSLRVFYKRARLAERDRSSPKSTIIWVASTVRRGLPKTAQKSGFGRNANRLRTHPDVSSMQLSCHVLLLAASLWLLGFLEYVSAQGLTPARGTQAGASVSMDSLKKLYANSQSLKAAWRRNRRATCSTGSSTVCGSQSSQDSQLLLLASSPISYDARVREQVSIDQS